MAHIIEMPKLSDDMTIGTIGRWLKNEGDAVRSGEPLAEVETDKATLELESPFEGILLKRFVGEGAKVLVDSPVCAIGTVAEKVETAGPRAQGPLSLLSIAAGEAPPPVASRVISQVEEFGQASAKKNPPAGLSLGAKLALSPNTAQRVRISPLARKLAKAKGIDPTTVAGSGPQGRIVRLDILSSERDPLVERARPPLSPPARGAVVNADSTAPGVQFRRPEKVVPNSSLRTTIARRLVESKTQIPHFYLEIEIDAAPLLALRSQLNAAWGPENLKVSINDFMLKASAFALVKVPEVNSSWGGDWIRLHRNVDVSFAVAIDEGLITPVVRDTSGKSLASISVETKALAVRAKEKKLLPAEYTDGTFCVTNLGMMGVTRFSAIINPPNSAILAVGATVQKPVVQANQLVIGERLALTLSCDHRVVDGVIGARFLNEIRGFLETPLKLLADSPDRTPI